MWYGDEGVVRRLKEWESYFLDEIMDSKVLCKYLKGVFKKQC